MQSRLFSVLLMLLLSYCGEIGIAINISREQPVGVQIEKEIDSVLIGINEQLTFSLQDSEAFSEYLPKLNDIGNISFNHLAYSIDSLNSLENGISINKFVIQVINKNDTLEVINEVNQLLENREKTIIPISQNNISSISTWLFNQDTLTTNIVFELTDFPAGLDTVGFRFTTYFDATLKARDIDL